MWIVVRTERVRCLIFATRSKSNLSLFECINAFYTPGRRRSGDRSGEHMMPSVASGWFEFWA